MTDAAACVSMDERLAGEYHRSRLRMRSLVRELDPAGAQRRVPACPAWTIADLLAHLSGLAGGYGTGRVPDGDRQAWLDGFVAERSGRELGQIMAEWDGVGPLLEQEIATRPERRWPLVYDVIAHEHDLRGALGRPGARVGTTIRLGLELGLRITANDLGRYDLPALRVVAEGMNLVAGDGPPELTLEASAFEAFRLLGSRRTLAEMRAAAFAGDVDRYLPGLVHMRLPTHSLGE